MVILKLKENGFAVNNYMLTCYAHSNCPKEFPTSLMVSRKKNVDVMWWQAFDNWRVISGNVVYSNHGSAHKPNEHDGGVS